MKSKEIEVGAYRILWLLKPIKRMHLRIKPPHGEIVLSTPMRVSKQEATQFVTSHLDWIREKRPDCIVRTEPPVLANGDVVPLFGEHLALSVSLARRTDAAIIDGKISLFVRDDSQKCRRAALDKLYRAELKARAAAYFQRYGEMTGLYPEQITYRAMKTRWGSCLPSKKKIALNLRLAFFAPACLEYVVLHELVHLVHQNHGKGFYAMLAQYMPDWRARKSLLAASSCALKGREPL